MRIDRIAIDGFGIWHDATFTPQPGLTVLVGGNEAGKTTLLAFVRAILFGFEVNRYPALAGGRRGGALDLSTADGRHIRVERHGDRGGEGRLVIRDEAGDERPPEQLARLLHGVEAAVYRNVFAFRLEELTEFRGLTEGGIASRIYGAGLGTGGASALAVEERLRREAADIFKSGGQNPTVNRLLRALEDVDRQLAALDIPATYSGTTRRLAVCEETRTELSAAIATLEAERRSLERIDAGWDAWIALGTATDALAGLPPAGPMPPDAVERLTLLESELRASSERADLATRRRSGFEQQLSETVPDRELLGHRSEIATLLTARDVDRGRDDVLAQGREELGIAIRRLDEALALLGDGWDEGALAAVDTSVAVRAELAGRFRDLLEGSRRQVELAEHDEARAAAAAIRAATDLDDLDRRIGELPSTEADSARSADQIGVDLATVEGTAGGRPPPGLTAVAPAALVAAIGLATAGALAANGWMPLGIVALAAASVVTVWLWKRRTATPPDEAGRSAATAAARRLGLSFPPIPSELAAARAALDARRVAVARVAGLLEQREIVARRATGAAEELDVARGRLADARAAATAAQAEWSTWLDARHLVMTLDREAALATIDAVGAARATAGRRDDAARLVDRTSAGREAFEAEGRRLLAALGRPLPPGRPLGDALDRLQRDLRLAERAEELRRRLDEQLVAARVEEAAALDRHDRDQAARDAFLVDCGVADQAGLRRRAAEVAERARHEQRAASARETLVALAGPGAAFEQLVAEIGAVEEIAERRDRLSGLRGELEALAVRRDAAGEEIGALQHELRRLETSVEASDLRQARADLVARLHAEAERWSVRSLAVALLERTRRTYEREHRPGVIRAAESYLADWTAGRYPRLVAPLGGSIEGLERQDGRVVPLAGLSRGTAEQLYLALRFGLIEHFADEAEPLPIVMDEILVNFDAARSALAAQAIRRLAERHQILYFTCHQSTAALLDPDGVRTLPLG